VSDGLLGPAEVRTIAERLGIRPTKAWGQNFVIDPNTVRRIVRLAEVGADDVVLEVGPGLGSLTLGLLEQVGRVVAIEVDRVLAAELPRTVAARRPDLAGADGLLADRLEVLAQDALSVRALPGPPPTALVANLPYNVAVPVVLTALDAFPSIRRGLVMVQAEVAERLAAAPGSRTYGAPSAKAAWYADVQRAGSVSRSVFWPVPNVDSGLVALTRRDPPPSTAGRAAVFACIDAAFAQRRKMLRSALAGWAGSATAAADVLASAGVDPTQRGEQLTIEQFAAVADARPAGPAPGSA
jgi:16S rRNA (adenine1518-N6/adenine1519-N6)-dimethyltransferase